MTHIGCGVTTSKPFHPPAGLGALRPTRSCAGIVKALFVILHLESDLPPQAPGDVE